MTTNRRVVILLMIVSFICFSNPSRAQPIDFSNCPTCGTSEISIHAETVNHLQGIRGNNPFRPYSYGLIGKHKYSGNGLILLNPFFGLNWFPIRLEKQHLTGQFISFGISNYGDESDWNIYILPDPPFQQLITEALPYQKDNWYASGDWRQHTDGRFMIEAEVTPDEKRYGNPWFNNQTHSSPLINKKITVYGPFVREEAHGNHPEIHPAEQLWWQEPGNQHIVLLVIDDSNRFKEEGDFSAERVKITPAHPWVMENGQRATMSYAFEVNPAVGGAYIAIQAIDDLEFWKDGNFADASEGTKHVIKYKGNVVLTVQEADATDKFLGIKFRSVCFNEAKGTLQGFVDIETAIGNGDGKEGFVALQINKQDVPLNPKPALFTGDIANTWKNFAPYDEGVSFSDIYRGNMYGNGMVHGIIDFNGNGKSDLFAHKNGSWLVMFDGKGPWVEINSSNIPVSEYRFGDINGDGITDILRNGPDNKIVISYGGRGPWTVLTDGGEQNKNFQLGDFDGNGRADILYTKFKIIGGSGPSAVWRADMYVKYNGTGSFKEINSNFHTNPTDYFNNFRLGNFNDDNITDVFRWHDNKFRVYYGGRGEIKDLATVPAGYRPVDLYFVQNMTFVGKTDIIHIHPTTRQWTVYNGGRPGTLPLTIKHADPNNIVFADLDADLAVEPVALEFVAGETTTPSFPVARKAEIAPSIMTEYVAGSLKPVTIAGKKQLSFSQDLFYYAGRSDRSLPAPMSITSVKDMITAKDLLFAKATTADTASNGYVKIGQVQNIAVGPGKAAAYAINSTAMDQKRLDLPNYGITSNINNYTAQVGEAGNWDSWKVYLNTLAKPGKNLMLQQPPAAPKMIRSISFEVLPFYSIMEDGKISEIEADGVAKELNEIAYGKNVFKRLNMLGVTPFNITYTYELKNLTRGQVMPISNPNSIAKTGKWKNSKVIFNFPASNDLLQFTVKATIKDGFGHTQPKPLEFVFWNQQIETNGTAEQLNTWLNQFLGTQPGFIWVIDHWERVRAGQQNQPQPLQISAAYFAEDKILTVKEVEQIVK